MRLESYSVLLDYPDPAQPNLVRVLGPTGEELFRSQHREEGVDDDKLIDIFNAYSLNGRAEGAPIYTNYGRVEDFRYLLDSQGSQFTKGPETLICDPIPIQQTFLMSTNRYTMGRTYPSTLCLVKL